MAFPREFFLAHITLERFLSRVNPHMCGEIAYLREFLLAHTTLEGSLSRMNPHMLCEMDFLREFFLAYTTLERSLSLMTHLVPHHLDLPRESFAANPTRVLLLTLFPLHIVVDLQILDLEGNLLLLLAPGEVEAVLAHGDAVEVADVAAEGLEVLKVGGAHGARVELHGAEYLILLYENRIELNCGELCKLSLRSVVVGVQSKSEQVAKPDVAFKFALSSLGNSANVTLFWYFYSLCYRSS